MSNEDNFLIARAGESFRKGSGITVEEEALIFHSLCKFLCENGLTKDPQLCIDRISWEGFEIRSAQLNSEGIQVMRYGLSRWLGSIDNGKSPTDVTPLLKALQKVRNG